MKGKGGWNGRMEWVAWLVWDEFDGMGKSELMGVIG